MIWTIAIIFALVWALGLATAYTLGGTIHVLLGVAVVLFVAGAFKAGRRRGVATRPRPPAPPVAPGAGTAPADGGPA